MTSCGGAWAHSVRRSGSTIAEKPGGDRVLIDVIDEYKKAAAAKQRQRRRTRRAEASAMSGDPHAADGGPTTALFGAGTVFKLAYRDGKGVFHGDWPRDSIDDALADSAGLLWVDILGPDEQASPLLEDWLCSHFQFHHLAVEDALSETHVAKVDDWGEYLYIVFHVAGFEPELGQARAS